MTDWPDWRPIETAPKGEGRQISPILITYKGGGGLMVREARWNDRRRQWETAYVYIDENSTDLLGWLPLPPPPKGEAT